MLRKALPVILESLTLSEDGAYDIYSDGLFESMPGIMYRLVGDDLDFYDQILRNPKEPVVLQSCLLESLKHLVANKTISKETYGSWLRDYLEIAIHTERDEADKSEFITDIVCDIVDTPNPDYFPLVQTAFEEELVDVGMISWENVEEHFDGRDRDKREGYFERSLAEKLEHDYSNADAELEWWAWFQQDDMYDAEEYDDEDDDYDDEWIPASDFISPAQREVMQRLASDMFSSLAVMDKGSTIENKLEAIAGDLGASDKKVGRNDPCPCGSGRKYKMCCGKTK